MGESVETTGRVLVLGQSLGRRVIAIPAGALAVMIAVALVFRVGSWLALVAAGAAIVLAITRQGNVVLADDVGLLIRRRGELRRSYPWADIERMGWQEAGLWGSVLMLNPRGGPFDVPGPNSPPIGVARIWRPRFRRPPDPLPALLRQHGIKTLREP